MFKYSDWSNEFGSKLEEVTGLSGDLYKEIFEQDKKNSECYVYYDGNSILPIKVCLDIYSEEHSRIPITLLDDIVPQDALLYEQNLHNFDDLVIIPKNRENQLVTRLDSFQEHKSLLKHSFCHYYNRVNKVAVFKEYKGFFTDIPDEIVADFDAYWKEKTNNDCGLFKESKLYQSLLTLKKEDVVSLLMYVNDELIGVSYNIFFGGELHALLDLRRIGEAYNPYRICNIFVFKKLEMLCYPLGLNMNNGSSYNESPLFDYKRGIKPHTLIPVKGVRFK